MSRARVREGIREASCHQHSDSTREVRPLAIHVSHESERQREEGEPATELKSQVAPRSTAQ